MIDFFWQTISSVPKKDKGGITPVIVCFGIIGPDPDGFVVVRAAILPVDDHSIPSAVTQHRKHGMLKEAEIIVYSMYGV
jgi:hypothetical protein